MTVTCCVPNGHCRSGVWSPESCAHRHRVGIQHVPSYGRFGLGLWGSLCEQGWPNGASGERPACPCALAWVPLHAAKLDPFVSALTSTLTCC